MPSGSGKLTVLSRFSSHVLLPYSPTRSRWPSRPRERSTRPRSTFQFGRRSVDRMDYFHLRTAVIFACYLLQSAFTSTVASSSAWRNGKVVVCYVGTWATYRPTKGAFHIDSIDPSLCSHLIYSFAGLDTATWKLKSLDPYNDLEENYGKGSFKKMTSLKSSQPHLKVTLAVGGWNEGSASYSEMASDPVKRASFVSSALETIQKYDFDGLDLDWEFPTKRGGRPEDKENFVALIKDLKNSFKPNGYILTAAISAGIDTLKSGYDLKQVAEHLDFVHLMCYDYHGSWDPVTGVNSPLGPVSDPLTVEASVTYVVANGVPAHKLVLGLPMYGRTFILESTPQENAPRNLGERSKSGAGFQGPFTRTDGFMGYNEQRTTKFDYPYYIQALYLLSTHFNENIYGKQNAGLVESTPYVRSTVTVGPKTVRIRDDPVEGFPTQRRELRTSSLTASEAKIPYDACSIVEHAEICLELKNDSWVEHWDAKSSTPFAVLGDKVISYDNAKSIQLKTIYAMDLDLAGVLVWSLDTDDFQGDCSSSGEDGKYALLKTINDAILQSSVTPRQRSKDPNSSSSANLSSTFLVISLVIFQSLNLK